MVPTQNTKNDAHNTAADQAKTPYETFSEHVTQWHEELKSHIQDRHGDNLPTIFLGNAHPGGLAQLYAQHPTRLENLVREPNAYKRALEGTRRINERQRQLAAQYGIAHIHLAIGHASWMDNGTKQHSPALLRRILIHDENGNITLTLGARVTIAPQLIRTAATHGITLDNTQLRQSATAEGNFSPRKAHEYLKNRCSAMNGFDIRDDLAMGIYEHPAEALLGELHTTDTLAHSAIVRALAGNTDVIAELTHPLPNPNPLDRDPQKERGIAGLTPREHDLLEAVLAGRSLFIQSPHNSDTALRNAILAEAAAQGLSTLYVAGSRSRLLKVQADITTAGFDEAIVRIDGSTGEGEHLRQRLLRATERDNTPPLNVENTNNVRQHLRDTRQLLTNYTTELHSPFAQFGVSAMDALQVLTEITSRSQAPRTKVRLREDVLHDIAQDQGQTARELLHRADELGMFTRASAHSAWSRAVLDTPEQVTLVTSAVQRLATDTIPKLRNAMSKIAGEAHITPALTIRQWQGQLTMLEGVREALDVFRPAVFERSAADMVIATAPARWRKEHGIIMKRAQRTRLIKHAKDLLLPGRHVEDLHRELVLVQEKRETWRQYSNADGWPILPTGLMEAHHITGSVLNDIDNIAPSLATGYDNLVDMNVDELQRLMDRLAADPEGAHLLPQRVKVLKEASDMGLDHLVTDLRKRHITGDMIDAELDLAWWASILAIILASNEAFHGSETLNLYDVLKRGRELDLQHIDTLLPRILHAVQRRRQHILGQRADKHAQIRAFLERDIPDAVELYARSGLVASLLPVVLTLPALVPALKPQGEQVDVLIVDDLPQTPVSVLIPLLARARQVIVFSHQRPVGAMDELHRVLPQAELPPTPSKLNDQVVRLLAHYDMPHVAIPQPEQMKAQPLNTIWVESTGLPAPGTNAVRSTTREVEVVIDTIIDHALQHPDQSLAVVALNETHAQRIRDGVARTLSQEVALQPFFEPAKLEPFVVADLTQAASVSRDRIILSVGFAKTPHGRVLHDFGVLSESGGETLFADALRCVRGDLTIVSSIRPAEVNKERLYGIGSHMLLDLLLMAQGQTPIVEGSWPVLEAEPDSLLIDLADRLYSQGLEVIPNVGVDGGLRIPLAIGHPSVPDRLLVAVLTDDAEYMAQKSVRVRDRVVPQQLRDQGWQVFMAMSLSVFIDPGAVAKRIVAMVLDEVDRIQNAEKVAEDLPAVPVVAELAPEELAALEATNDARVRHDEALTGMIHIITDAYPDERLSEDSGDVPHVVVAKDHPQRGPRPPIAKGLPLAAYGDDQLDELALWVRSDGVDRGFSELVEQLREALGLQRRGTQTDAVLLNVIRRTHRSGVSTAGGAANETAGSGEGGAGE